MKAGNQTYLDLADLPTSLALFPLTGALLLPAGNMPLNIFEPRYLSMLEDAIAGHRIIGMVQPRFDLADGEQSEDHPQLCEVGCMGRITAHQESGDGRVMINLSGVARFRIREETKLVNGYRTAKVAGFADDLSEDPEAAKAVDRDGLLRTFKQFLEANDMEADWDGVREANTETLVNTLSMMSPYGPAEKQALLEAPDLKTRSETLVAITEIMLAREAGTSSSTLQ
ncbi:LON peptidase substrate-binding domain-containing protein [Ahrensia sp. R2A130]|uniref:LON peptidase substrate-binding domain-containing protein n=1 Tax=Ahrensia sp. R2A130 TaxID=744979 RepID=UPI0001E0A4E9|nr:LON peptidase substrate-binding domain-containing protein [Ahrensia sp. R2A130]EFL88246.1 ATP-dependent protease La protein [Ahrensia sp. R2A130]